MTSQQPTTKDRSVGIRPGELIAMMAMSLALTALSIDIMLPAFPEMREAFGLAEDATQVSGVITAFLLGLGVAQIVYGPLADRFGRKPVLNAAYGFFAAGAVGCALSPSLPLLFVARFVWGVGAAGPRVLAISILRDVYQGERMARAMSFVMAIFITVPILAPSLGAVLIAVAPWRSVFWFCVVFVTVLALWTPRLPETQDPSHRIDASFRAMARATRQVLRQRVTVGYTIAQTLLFGAFISYLGTSEIIISDVFRQPDLFPIIFGTMAASMGISMLLNAKIVGILGARRSLHLGLAIYPAVAGVLVVFTVANSGRPPLWGFVALFGLLLGLHASLIPNLNTVAMDPVGHVAGTASAFIGTVSIGGGAIIGAVLGQLFNGTVTPLTFSFLATGTAGLLVVLWTERGHLSLRRQHLAAPDARAG